MAPPPSNTKINKFKNWVIKITKKKYFYESISALALITAFFTNIQFDLFFPVSALVFFYLVGKHAYKFFLLPSDKNLLLSEPNTDIKEQKQAEQKDKSLEERVNDAKKYAFQYVLLPLFFGMVTYLVSDTIAGKKELITIGITEHSPYNSEVLLEHYRKKYINVANRLLGNSDLSFEVVTISGKYKNIWTALDKERIDIAFVSPYNFYDKACDYKKDGDKLDSLFTHLKADTVKKNKPLYNDSISKILKTKFKKQGFKVIGGKYTELGDIYRFGFIVNKKDRDSLKDSKSIKKAISEKCKLILSTESRSTSGRIAPLYWLRKVTSLEDTISLGINEKIDSVAHSKNGKYVGTFSDDMWNFLKQHYPDSIKNLFFVPVNTLPLPLDAVVVKKSNWNKINSLGKNLMDLMRLRNIITLSSREKAIKRSLRLIMDSKNDSKNLLDNDYIDEYLKKCHKNKIGLMWWNDYSKSENK
jgi:hypothetical protein